MTTSIDTPLGYQQVTVLTAAAALSVPDKANYLTASADGAPVRYRDDSSAASVTSAVGVLLPLNTLLEYRGDLNALRFIEISATAKLNILYYARAK